MRTTKIALSVLTMGFILISFPGCGGKEEEAEEQQPVSLTVEPLVGIGDVKFGDSKDAVIAVLGEPDQTQAQGTELNYVASKGMSLSLDPDTGLKRIKLWSENMQPKPLFAVSTFTGKTKASVGMGANREQITTAYGDPDRISTPDSPALKDVIENLHYEKLKAKFTLADGNLVAVILDTDE